MAPNEPRQAYLKGTVVPGVFENERGFIVTSGDRTVALYASREDIVEETVVGSKGTARGEKPGKLKVFVIKTPGDLVHVLLRQEASTGERMLIVHRTLVEFMA